MVHRSKTSRVVALCGFLLALPVVFASLACSPDCIPSVHVPGNPFESWDEPAALGVTHSLRMSPTLTRSCNALNVDPDTVTVTVTDPTDQPVEATARLLDNLQAEVTFTPRVLGMHRVVADFEPRGGREQFDVMVYTDRKDSRWLLPLHCRDLVALSREAVVCADQLYRDGVAVGEPLLHQGPWLAGDGHLWSLLPNQALVLRDEGAGDLVEVANVPLELPSIETWDCSAVSGRRAIVTNGSPALWFLEIGEDGALLPPIVRRGADPGYRFAHCLLAGDVAILIRNVNDGSGGLRRELLRWRFGAPAPELVFEIKAGPLSILRELTATHFILEQRSGTSTRPTRRLSLVSLLPDDPLGTWAIVELPWRVDPSWPPGGEFPSGRGGVNGQWVIHRVKDGFGLQHFNSPHATVISSGRLFEHHVVLTENDRTRVWMRHP